MRAQAFNRNRFVILDGPWCRGMQALPMCRDKRLSQHRILSPSFLQQGVIIRSRPRHEKRLRRNDFFTKSKSLAGLSR
jgi:hypothetical protein